MLNKILKSAKKNDKSILLIVNIEKVYRVFYDSQEIVNTLELEEAEYLFDLTFYGYDKEIILGLENEDDNDY